MYHVPPAAAAAVQNVRTFGRPRQARLVFLCLSLERRVRKTSGCRPPRTRIFGWVIGMFPRTPRENAFRSGHYVKTFRDTVVCFCFVKTKIACRGVETDPLLSAALWLVVFTVLPRSVTQRPNATVFRISDVPFGYRVRRATGKNAT